MVFKLNKMYVAELKVYYESCLTVGERRACVIIRGCILVRAGFVIVGTTQGSAEGILLARPSSPLSHKYKS